MSSSYQTKTFAEITWEPNEELRTREAERYEALLRERFKEHYPNPTEGQKRKIEARVQNLMERHVATLDARIETEVPPLRRFEEQLQQRLAARFPDLSLDQARRLQERIAQAVERQRGRIVEARRLSLDETRSAAPRTPGGPQHEFHER
jgi:hypothetical protein